MRKEEHQAIGCVDEEKAWTAVLGIAEWKCQKGGGNRFSCLSLSFQTPPGDDRAQMWLCDSVTEV